VPHTRPLRFLVEADRLFRRACVDQDRSHFHEALRKFSTALVSYKHANHRSSQVDTLLKIGDISRQTESFKNARRAYRSAFELVRKSRISVEIQKRHDALLGEALCLRGEGHYKQALQNFRACLSYYEQSDDLEGQAYILWAMGTTERFAGQFKKAERHLKKSGAFYIRIKDQSGAAYALSALGGTHRMMGHPKKSLLCYRRANAIFKKFNDRFGLAYSFCGQSNALRMQNKINEALPLMERAERLYRSLKLKGPLAFVLWSRSQAYCAIQRWDAAEKTLTASSRLFRAVRDQRGLLYANLGRAGILMNKNKLIYKRVFKESLKKATQLSLPFETAHALRASHPKRAATLYRRCGVSSQFFLYRTLP